MVQRIASFSIGQTAKVFGVLYAIIGLIMAPIFILASMFMPSEAGIGIGVAIAFPILYGLAGLVFTAIGCVLYNVVAGMVGGIEVQLKAPGE